MMVKSLADQAGPAQHGEDAGSAVGSILDERAGLGCRHPDCVSEGKQPQNERHKSKEGNYSDNTLTHLRALENHVYHTETVSAP